MAKKAKKKSKYSRSSGSDVKNEMRRYKKGTAKSAGNCGASMNRARHRTVEWRYNSCRFIWFTA